VRGAAVAILGTAGVIVLSGCLELGGSSGSTSATSTSTVGSSGTTGSSSTGGSGSTGEGTSASGQVGDVCYGEEDCFKDNIDDLYCDFRDGACGEGGPGVCRIPNDGCVDPPAGEEEPVCGCKGGIFLHSCVADEAAVSLDSRGTCAPPDGYYRCGWRMCRLGAEYCAVFGGDVETYGCQAYPPTCAEPPTCACLADERCGDACETSREGELVLSCPSREGGVG
jgi:hypothetical protein